MSANVNSHIYILTDGTNTKIGITTDLKKRIQSYQTHNPNFLIHKTYACNPEEAKRIESVIKSTFKDRLSGKSKEWFQVEAKHLERYVSTLIQDAMHEELTPAMHGVQLTDDAHELKQRILNAIDSENATSRSDLPKMKNEFSELFSTHFRLGIPRHKLPSEIVFKDGMGVDLENCELKSLTAQNAVRKNYVELPCDDHTQSFYHLVRLSSGHNIAIATARVSMPYLEAIENKRTITNEIANQLGWHVTWHNHWSWHYPEKTGLILYQQKTSVSKKLNSWENSFRKWVIERSELLKQERFHDEEKLEKTIEDITRDCTFPLNVGSYQEFVEQYINIFFGLPEEDFYYRDAYEFLFRKWKPL